MEKLENHIKKSLEEREIKPSPRAWERISVQVEQKKERNFILPISIAASVVFMVLFALQFLLINEEETLQPTLESNPNTVVSIDNSADDNNTDDSETITLNQKEEVEFNTSIQESFSEELEIVFKEDKENTEEVLELNQKEYVSLNKIEVSEEAIAISAQNLLSEVLAMEKDTDQITDAEIDSLLLIAQKQLLAERINPKMEDGEIDAMALLNEVELELIATERNQLFDRLKESFFKLRTAVADRNK
ncbi:hypothetical protein [Croceivirga thetidis]|uniref:Anti-sigma factor n=1 Tax=Croceivirga thetidis TaxID=2721623 RepID=A0ABX1GN56_9FLAO|nr:hypothetical protein [Croceivirga thetidis]NKI30471.1 hypothetical protein [Croceivirga thetidis]